MSDKSKDHKFFFPKDMKGGNIERKVVDGLVKLSWYLPSGNREQILQQEICWRNFRGDARKFKIQLNILLKISSVVCIILPSACPVEILSDIFENATHGEAKLFCEKAHANEKWQLHAQAHKEYFKDLKNKHGKMLSFVTKAKKFKEYYFLLTIRKSIQKNINNVTAKLASWPRQYGIQHNDSKSDALFAKEADSWLKMGIEDAKNLLNLQKYVLEFVELEREIHLENTVTANLSKNIKTKYRKELEKMGWLKGNLPNV